MVPCGQLRSTRRKKAVVGWTKNNGHENYSGQILGVHYRPRCETFVARNEGEYIGVNMGGGHDFLATISVTGFGGEIVFFSKCGGKAGWTFPLSIEFARIKHRGGQRWGEVGAP